MTDKVNSYEAYKLYSALRLHFMSEKYDYFKYNGKTKVMSKEKFASSMDRLKYYRLAKRSNNIEQLKDYIISNMIEGVTFVLELLSDRAEENFKNFQKTKESLTYRFKSDLIKLDKDSFRKTEDGKIKVYELYRYGEISLETFIILNHYIGFFKNIDDVYGKDDIIWKPIRILSEKYKPFISWNKKKFMDLIEENILTTY